MKKIYALLILCFMNTTQADELFDAIRASDVERVEGVMQQKAVGDRSSYVALAQEVLAVRRKNLEQGEFLCQMYMSPTASYVPGTMPYFVAMACSGMGIAAVRYNLVCRYYESAIVLYLSSIVSFMTLKKMKDYKELDYLQTMYEKAWDINTLISSDK